MKSPSVATTLSAAAALLAFATAGGLAVAGSFGLSEAALLTVGCLSVAAAVCARRRLTGADMELAAERAAIQTEQQELKSRRTELDQFIAATNAELTERARKLDARDVELSSRLANFREWLEYPHADVETTAESQPVAAPRELSEQDHQVLAIIDAESRQLYQRLRDGHYKPEGKIDAKRIREDMHSFVIRVAQVYRPGVENPLLETSLDQLLRAGSRACLHLLVVLERLPLNPKDRNISTLHGYLQKALKAYELYTSAQPYFGYMQTVSYAGRWLAGASPLTLGISWALTELGKRGMKAATDWLVDQQAVAVLNEVVRVVAFEVASIYGGDFRHRDPNWVFASELTDLMSRFPLSRENLSQALREIGAVPLRSEYDRIFLYRCLATHRSVRPLVEAHELLSPADRQKIARQLAKFFEAFIHGKTRKLVEPWQSDVETRLGVKLQLSADASGAVPQPSTSGLRDEQLAVCRSLAGFLICVKGCAASDLSSALPFAESFQNLDKVHQKVLITEIAENPPFSFAPPNIEPTKPETVRYVADLCRLAARARPWDVPADEVVLETALFFGLDVDKNQKQLAREYHAAFTSLLPKDAPGSNLETLIMKLALAELGPGESPQFAYADLDITWPDQTKHPDGKTHAGLIGTNARLLLIEASDRGSLIAFHVWSANSDSQSKLRLDKIPGRLIDDCQISGVAWQIVGQETPATITARCSGTMRSRYEVTFQPLIAASIRDAERHAT